MGKRKRHRGAPLDLKDLPPLPADTFFGEDCMNIYREWQALQTNTPLDRHGTLPTAFEYADFIAWCSRQRLEKLPLEMRGAALLNSAKILDNTGGKEALQGLGRRREWKVAQKCGHRLHPAHLGVSAWHSEEQKEDEKEEEDDDDDDYYDDELLKSVPRCPMCMIDAHKNFLSALARSWARLGGPWRLPCREQDLWAATNRERYSLANFASSAKHRDYRGGYALYRRGKMDMIHTVCDIEHWAEAERDWEKQNLDADVTAVRPYSATEAMKVVWRDHAYATSLIKSHHNLGLRDSERNTHGRTQTTCSTSGLPLRPKCRKTVSFVTGSNEVPIGWDDTSFKNDWLYSISQSRILLTIRTSDSVPEVSYRYRDLNAAPHFAENKHVLRLQAMLKNWLESLPEQDRTRQTHRMTSCSEIYLVHAKDCENDDEFIAFCGFQTLVGTVVEQFARLIGDIGEEEDEEFATIQAWLGSRSYVPKDTGPVEASGTDEVERKDNKDVDDCTDGEVVDTGTSTLNGDRNGQILEDLDVIEARSGPEQVGEAKEEETKEEEAKEEEDKGDVEQEVQLDSNVETPT